MRKAGYYWIKMATSSDSAPEWLVAEWYPDFYPAPHAGEPSPAWLLTGSDVPVPLDDSRILEIDETLIVRGGK
jgi:hypothetical protein